MKIRSEWRLPKLSTFLFDIDGVFTQRCSSQFHCGMQVQPIDSNDLESLQSLRKAGHNIGFISGGSEEGVMTQLLELGFKNMYPKQRFKLDALQEIISFYDLEENEIFYMGDDLGDEEIMKRVGCAASPRDAAPEIQRLSHIISNLDGGAACVHEVINYIQQIQGDLK